MHQSKKGFNLIGYATSPMGLGEDLRSFAAMLDYLKIPFSVIDAPTDVQGKLKVSWKCLTTEDYETSIFFMAPMECQKLADDHPYLFNKTKKKIGYFLWELPDFPEHFIPALQLVDQIWCPTKFVQDTFFKKSKQLVLTLPLPVVQQPPAGRDFRAEHNIPNDAFVVLFMFDLQSTMKRKNPEATLSVFNNFAKKRHDTYLLMKVNRWQSLGKETLAWIPNHPRIKIIIETLEPGQLTDLYQSSDCYLSLHRSEGFGRTLVEAMQNGLYIVSTDYSGPKDFLTDKNSFLVDWHLIDALPQDYPYLKHKSSWAEPQEQSAINQLHQSYIRKKLLGLNRKGVEDGQKYTFEALASKYAPILKTYLR
jgi:glycosyltransferase involved in cell wall biosynthesis